METNFNTCVDIAAHTILSLNEIANQILKSAEDNCAHKEVKVLGFRPKMMAKVTTKTSVYSEDYRKANIDMVSYYIFYGVYLGKRGDIIFIFNEHDDYLLRVNNSILGTESKRLDLARKPGVCIELKLDEIVDIFPDFKKLLSDRLLVDGIIQTKTYYAQHGKGKFVDAVQSKIGGRAVDDYELEKALEFESYRQDPSWGSF